MNVFDFDVPQELIAQRPADGRDTCRLMVLERPVAIGHRIFKDLPHYLDPGDVLVINVSRVIPARLIGHKITGGKTDVLFLEHRNNGHPCCWNVLLRRNINPGVRILFPGGLSGTIIDKNVDGSLVMATEGPDVQTVLDRFGFMPLPPYIKRQVKVEDKVKEKNSVREGDTEDFDRDWYQTVYASVPGSVAAPTAGLHFTGTLLEALRGKGITIVEVTLHVGWATFRRPSPNNGTAMAMLPEQFNIGEETANKINRAKIAGHKVFGVGTTTVRALETAAGDDGLVKPGTGETALFIRPGHRFRIVDAIITNFHLPGYTPLYLAAAFAGETLLQKAYEEAIRERYRFYSYGDAMLIL